MKQNSSARVKQIAANRTSAKTAAVTNPVSFQDWLFFGTAPNVFVNVGIVPTSSSVVIQYALVVLQTPGGDIVSDAAINYSNPAAGVASNLATNNGTYDIGTWGNQLEAWAYVLTDQGDQYSSTQNYTVS
jgi:hypothetical protein